MAAETQTLNFGPE
uniref:GRB10 interacting GYF protein 2 n=7 Tax=Amniota TaxID=32524 RepID=A0A7I2YQP8_HUMAN